MCWHCDSLHDPKCVDPFDNHSMPMKDCKLEKLDTYPGVRGTMCRKIRQKGKPIAGQYFVLATV